MPPVTEKIIADIRQRRWRDLKAVVPYLHPSELAGLLTDLPTQKQAVFFRLLPESVAAPTFEYLDPLRQQGLILIRQLG
jgi:Mg/Co/Ni transporter MgtE